MEFQCTCPSGMKVTSQIVAPWTDASLDAWVASVINAACPKPCVQWLKVVDIATGAPIPLAVVRVNTSPAQQATTTSDGRCQFQVVSGQYLTFTASKSDYAEGYTSFTVCTSEQTIRLQKYAAAAPPAPAPPPILSWEWIKAAIASAFPIVTYSVAYIVDQAKNAVRSAYSILGWTPEQLVAEAVNRARAAIQIPSLDLDAIYNAIVSNLLGQFAILRESGSSIVQKAIDQIRGAYPILNYTFSSFVNALLQEVYNRYDVVRSSVSDLIYKVLTEARNRYDILNYSFSQLIGYAMSEARARYDVLRETVSSLTAKIIGEAVRRYPILNFSLEDIKKYVLPTIPVVVFPERRDFFADIAALFYSIDDFPGIGRILKYIGDGFTYAHEWFLHVTDRLKDLLDWDQIVTQLRRTYEILGWTSASIFSEVLRKVKETYPIVTFTLDGLLERIKLHIAEKFEDILDTVFR
jgi:hypothetical protein